VQELHGGIMENIERALIFLQRNLRMRYVISGIRRENIPELPLEALREAVINAVCHRDYAEEGASVMVEIFDNRIDITNPGGLPKGLTKENFGTISVARNGVIANLLHRARYIEKMGTGIPRMRHAADTSRMPAPTFSFDGFFRISFPRPVLAADEIAPTGETVQETGEKTREKTRERTGEKTVGKTRGLLLDTIRTNPLVTTRELAQVAGISPRGVEWQLEQLKKGGIIKRNGPDNGGRWEVVT
jgi:ATP-dependent DNA helicase RecG